MAELHLVVALFSSAKRLTAFWVSITSLLKRFAQNREIQLTLASLMRCLSTSSPYSRLTYSVIPCRICSFCTGTDRLISGRFISTTATIIQRSYSVLLVGLVILGLLMFRKCHCCTASLLMFVVGGMLLLIFDRIFRLQMRDWGITANSRQLKEWYREAIMRSWRSLKEIRILSRGEAYFRSNPMCAVAQRPRCLQRIGVMHLDTTQRPRYLLEAVLVVFVVVASWSISYRNMGILPKEAMLGTTFGLFGVAAIRLLAPMANYTCEYA